MIISNIKKSEIKSVTYTHVAIMSWGDDNYVSKYQPCESVEEAISHVSEHVDSYPDAFVADYMEGGVLNWLVEVETDDKHIRLVTNPIIAINELAYLKQVAEQAEIMNLINVIEGTTPESKDYQDKLTTNPTSVNASFVPANDLEGKEDSD